MTIVPRITTLAWVPPFARGFVRDLRPRWAFEEVGQTYAVDLVRDCKSAEHRRAQPFGQVPSYRDDEVAIFESGAIVLRIAERAGQLIPHDPGARVKAIQWLVAALNTVEPVVMAYAANEFFEGDRPWTDERRPLVVGAIEARLGDLQTDLGDKPWLDGDTFTVGDLVMVSVLGGLRGTGVLDGFPGLAAYAARGEARPAHQRAMAAHMATYEAAPSA